MGRGRLLRGSRRRIAEAGGRGVGGGRENGGRLQHGLLRRIIGARRCSGRWCGFVAVVLSVLYFASNFWTAAAMLAIEGEAAATRTFDWRDPISRKKVTSRPKSEQPAVGSRAAACWRNAVRRNREERATARSRLFFLERTQKAHRSTEPGRSYSNSCRPKRAIQRMA